MSTQVPALTRFRIAIDDNTHVGEVIMSRGEKLNVMDRAFFEELGVALEYLEASDRVNAVLLWAEGKLFTAGLDLKAMNTLMDPNEEDLTQRIQLWNRLKEWQRNFNRAHTMTKPTIAAIHGRCIGGGIDLISAFDIRLATQDATFSIKEAEVGIVADLGTLQRLHRIVGSGLVREMAFTSHYIDAQRALHGGLVNGPLYATHDELVAGARAMATRMAALSPLVIQGTKIALNYAEEHSLEDSLAQVALWNTAFLKSDDLVEAMMAFMAKRPPQFRNRL